MQQLHLTSSESVLIDGCEILIKRKPTLDGVMLDKTDALLICWDYFRRTTTSNRFPFVLMYKVKFHYFGAKRKNPFLVTQTPAITILCSLEHTTAKPCIPYYVIQPPAVSSLPMQKSHTHTLVQMSVVAKCFCRVRIVLSIRCIAM